MSESLTVNCTPIQNEEISEQMLLTYDIIGYIGGSILSICLIPQIVKIIKTKSAKDISYVWQVTCLVGLIFIQTHNVLKNILPLVIPGSLEILCYVITLLLKIYYDHYAKQTEKKDSTDTTTTTTTTTTISPSNQDNSDFSL